MDPLLRAVDAVPAQRYALNLERPATLPRTAPSAIYRDLRRLGVRTGMRVLEIGTGTGATSALLAELVGPDGRVTSVDTDPYLVGRAARIHAERGITNVDCVARAGADTVPGGPFDRVIAWSPVPCLPTEWFDRIGAGAIIVTPVKIAPLAMADVVLRATVAEDGRSLVCGWLWEGGRSDVGPRPDEDVEVPGQDCDAWARPLGVRDAVWASALWLRGRPVQEGRALLDRMLLAPHIEPNMLGGEDPLIERLTWTAFWYYLLAWCPPGLTTVGLGRLGYGIGCTGPDHSAVLTSAGHLIADSVASDALATVRNWQIEWENAGRPGVECLRPRFERVAAGWQVRAFPVRPPQLPDRN